ncbi:MAG: mechanosensitive ion channel [Bacteroidetes bacterium]|nr:mechanosensitive ion channel [Bacteroidota bacterium]
MRSVFWWNYQWGDNTLGAYLIVGAVILSILILRQWISQYLAGLLFRLVHRIWKGVDKPSFVSLVFRPLGFFFTVLVSVAALYKLRFPSFLEWTLFDFTTRQIIHTSGTMLLIGSFLALLLRMIDFIALLLSRRSNLNEDLSENQLIVFFKDFFKVLLIIIGILLMVRFAFGFQVGELLTGLSLVGAAIALALRESLENLIASFIIFFDKPFHTGDQVKVHSISGVVERIGLRSTRIRTEQKTYVTVPNKQMVDSLLDNLTERSHRRGDLRLELDLRTRASQVEEIIRLVQELLSRPPFESTSVHFSDVTGNALVVTAEYYVPVHISVSDFLTLRQSAYLKLMKELEAMGIELAGTTTEVRVKTADR